MNETTILDVRFIDLTAGEVFAFLVILWMLYFFANMVASGVAFLVKENFDLIDKGMSWVGAWTWLVAFFQQFGIAIVLMWLLTGSFILGLAIAITSNMFMCGATVMLWIYLKHKLTNTPLPPPPAKAEPQA
jgi:uncharacterized membrane protein